MPVSWCVGARFQDMYAEVSQVKAALEDVADSEQHAPTGTPSGTPPPTEATIGDTSTSEPTLMELIQEAKWRSALKWARQNRSTWAGEVSAGPTEDYDIVAVLTVYCRHLAVDKPDMYVVTRTERELGEALDNLLSTLFLVLESVTLETQVNDLRHQVSLAESNLRQTADVLLNDYNDLKLFQSIVY